jgi:hypothetical protein
VPQRLVGKSNDLADAVPVVKHAIARDAKGAGAQVVVREVSGSRDVQKVGFALALGEPGDQGFGGRELAAVGSVDYNVGFGGLFGEEFRVFEISVDKADIGVLGCYSGALFGTADLFGLLVLCEVLSVGAGLLLP